MTHNERVLRLLSDGKPHTHHELYGLHVIAHSRISDLRKRGHTIEQWRDGDLYLYRLVKDSAGERVPPPTAIPSAADGRSLGSDGEPSPAEIHPDQKSLFGNEERRAGAYAGGPYS